MLCHICLHSEHGCWILMTKKGRGMRRPVECSTGCRGCNMTPKEAAKSVESTFPNTKREFFNYGWF